MAFMAHNWVEINILPVTIDLDEKGNLVSHTSDEGLALAFSGEDRQTICWGCKQHLSHEVYDSACPEAPTQEHQSNH